MKQPVNIQFIFGYVVERMEEKILLTEWQQEYRKFNLAKK
jgi:hypothetical protein